MNRQEFMKKLEELLCDISPAEREDAIEYYNDYFEEAGIENEEGVLRELESPEKVARTIKEELLSEHLDAGEYTETGYRREAASNSNQVVARAQTAETVENEEKKRPDWSRIILIGILAILFLPALGTMVGVVAGIFGALVGVVAGIFGLIIVLFALGLAAWIGGIALLVAAVVSAFTPGNALLLAGLGLLFLAVGCLLLIVAVWSCGIVPAMVRGCVKLCKKIFKRKGA